MEDKKKVGRPEKITGIVLGKLEDAFSIGASDRQACKHAGINPDTLYNYQKRHPEFVERKEMLKENPILKAKYAVYKGLDDPKIALEYLKLRDDDFSTKLKQEINNKNGITITVADDRHQRMMNDLQNANLN